MPTAIVIDKTIDLTSPPSLFKGDLISVEVDGLVWWVGGILMAEVEPDPRLLLLDGEG